MIQQAADQGLPFVLAGPSGVGKSSIFQAILERRAQARLSISATTRAPRGDEIDGEHYFFLTVEEFERRITADDFIEYAKVFDRDYYGTPRSFIVEQGAAGNDILLDIDVQGAAQLRERLPEVVLIFLAPPSREELERRLRSRGTDDEEAIARRLATADKELSCAQDFDFLVVNDDLDTAVSQVDAIMTACRCRIAEVLK